MSVSILLRRAALCAGLVGAVGASLAGCGGGGSSSPGTNTTTTGGTTTTTGGFTAPGTSPFVASNFASRGVCTANPHQNGRARWTVLVYMNAASNLQPDSLINIAQMAAVGSDANLNIVVQWKQTATSSYFSSVAVQTTPSFIGTRRYLIKRHSQADQNRIAPAGVDTNSSIVGDTTVLDADRLANPSTDILTDQGNPTADMGDYRTLAEFVQWGEANYPADHVGLVIWDHGSGALNVLNRAAKATNSRAAVKKVTRGLSQDTETGNQIATQEIPLALAGVPHKIDTLVIDCSLQGATEVAYDVRNSARVMVASEESPPGQGYPYNTWLAFLDANAASPCDSGKNLISDTIATYPSSTNITQSMTDLSKMDAVAAVLNTFGGKLANNASGLAAQIQTARQGAQFFEFVEYKDLYDFAHLIRNSSGAPADLVQSAGDMETSLLGPNGAILMTTHGPGTQESLATGLSIFLPGPQTQSSVDNTVGFDPAWNQLGLAKAAPNWANFLQSQRQ